MLSQPARRRAGIVAIILALTLGSVLAHPAEAQRLPAPGKSCPKKGATATMGDGTVLTCKRTKKGKLVWVVKSRPSTSGAIPAVIESWGIDIGPYDAATQTAGDLYVGPIPFPAGSVQTAPVIYYGGGPTRPQDPPDFVDPQMTFYVPIGTTVRAIASGTVCWVKKLETGYSDDFSIGIGVPVDGSPACQSDPATGQGNGTVATWEHEHVMDPQVSVGQQVVAGQEIAVASYYQRSNWLFTAGYALYEIGILTGSPDGRPQHLCPALYLAPKAKQSMLTQLAAAARAFEANTGTRHYDEATLTSGCVSEKPSLG